MRKASKMVEFRILERRRKNKGCWSLQRTMNIQDTHRWPKRDKEKENEIKDYIHLYSGVQKKSKSWSFYSNQEKLKTVLLLTKGNGIRTKRIKPGNRWQIRSNWWRTSRDKRVMYWRIGCNYKHFRKLERYILTGEK